METHEVYYSKEASLYCGISLEELRGYPIKGGTLKGFSPYSPYEEVDFAVRLMPRDIPLERFNETAQEVRFTRKWKVSVGYFPNGNQNVIVVYGT